MCSSWKAENKRRCILCGARDFAFWFDKNGFSVLRCSACGLVFADPVPKEEELHALYGREYYQGGGYWNYAEETALRTRDYTRWLNWVGRYVGRGGRWLDVGCATGAFMKVARERGWDVRGVDVSEYAVEEARSVGLAVAVGSCRTIPMEWGDFDVISMWETIEHLPDPAAGLVSAVGRLRPGGWLVASTGDLASPIAHLLGRRWWFMKPPDHLYFFDRRTLHTLFERTGLRERRRRYFGRRITLGQILHLLGCRESEAAWAHVPVYVNAFDTVTILAQKPFNKDPADEKEKR